MDIVKILIFLGVFAIILVVGVIIIIKTSKNKKTIQPLKTKETIEKVDKFEELMEVVKNPNSSSQALKKALISFNDNYPISDENLKESMIFLTYLLRHKNRNKELFDIIHKEVKVSNKKFKDEISKVEMKCLKS